MVDALRVIEKQTINRTKDTERRTNALLCLLNLDKQLHIVRSR
jgi:hypothetical protein